MSPRSGFPRPISVGLPAETIATLRRLICEAIDAPPHDRRAASSKSFAFLISNAERIEQFRPLRDMLFDVFRTSILHDVAREATGGDYLLLLDNCSMRRHRSENAESTLGFHFDGMFLGETAPAYNLCIALDDVGETAPGLGFVDDPDIETRLWDSFNTLRQKIGNRSVDPNFFERLIDDRTRAHLSRHMSVPRVEAGNGLLFDHRTLHVTQPVDAWTGERVSIEFRICRQGAVPEIYAAQHRRTARFDDGPDGYKVVVEKS